MAEKRQITIRPSSGGKKIISTRPSSLGDKPTSGGKVSTPKVAVEEVVVEEVEKVARAERVDRADADDKGIRAKKVCFFCQSKATPSYTDLVTLRKFLSDRAKIVPKLRSGLCATHQRAITKQIKYARH